MKCLDCEKKESEPDSAFCKECKQKKDIVWKTCKHCGAKGGEDKSNWVMDSCCRNCNDKIEKKIDFDQAKEDGHVTRDDSIMCPYCGYVQEDDIFEYHKDTKFGCPECDKESGLGVEYTAHFTTTKEEQDGNS